MSKQTPHVIARLDLLRYLTEVWATARDMHDYEAHLRAVEEDLEYYRTKRLEPRIFYLTRKGVISLYDILNAHFFLRSKSESAKNLEQSQKGTVARIRELEDGLDDYVKGISLVASGSIKISYWRSSGG